MQPATKKFKLVLLGEAGVGKSSIVLRLIKDEYVEYQHSTVGASFFRHSVSLDDCTINFDIWDTAGQERYKSLASMYYRGAPCALVVYDITSAESFERAQYWVKELLVNSSENIVIALTGNKCDLVEQRKVPIEEAKEYAAEHGLLYLETSAKNSVNVQEVFVEIARKLSSTLTVVAPTAPSNAINLDAQQKQARRCC